MAAENLAVGVDHSGEIPIAGCNFVNEQQDDTNSANLWEQQERGTYGMFVDNGLLFYREVADERDCNQLALPKSRRDEVVTVAHDMPRGVHISRGNDEVEIEMSVFLLQSGIQC